MGVIYDVNCYEDYLFSYGCWILLCWVSSF